MKYVIGIGNPGREYDGTRHNIGFAVLDAIGSADGAKLVKPQTFVNQTGDEVRRLARQFGVQAQDMLFVCDDVNLDFGKMRLRPIGSPGGHHGLESIAEAMGTDEFLRLRIGVRSPDMPKDLTGFVLGSFSKQEQKQLGVIVDRAAQICKSWIEKGFEAAQLQLSQLQSIQETK